MPILLTALSTLLLTPDLPPPSTPLLDGRCSEYLQLGAERHEVVDGIELFLFQDDDHVWLCATLPPESSTALDMYIEAPGLSEPYNLHLSAQLGEWPVSAGSPDRADSPRWWRDVEGWWGTPARFNGHRDVDGQRRVNWQPAPGQEMQLAKSRFGRGEWRFQVDIHGRLTGIESGQVFFPADTGEGHELFVLRAR